MRFALTPIGDLSSKHFEKHPAWADYSEPDDIETIASWGVERASIIRELERVDYSDAFVFPVLRTSPLPNFRFLHLSAQFTAADGTRFCGYVLGEEPCSGAVFHGDDAFGFNVSLPDHSHSELARLRQSTGFHLSPFFPLRYLTQFHRDDGEQIEGFLDLHKNESP